MTRGAEALGQHGRSIDAMLFEYLHKYKRYDAITFPDYEQTGWNNAVEFIASNIICNADFSQWLANQFHDKENGEKLIRELSDFIRKDVSGYGNVHTADSEGQTEA